VKTKTDPILKLRYCYGLGDILRCFLHFKYIGPIVFFLTKKDKTCKTCSNRAIALNMLFPIPVWKMFFTSEEKMKESLIKELRDYGYSVTDDAFNPKNIDNGSVIESKDSPHIKVDCIGYDGYHLIEKNEICETDFKTIKLVFKKI